MTDTYIDFRPREQHVFGELETEEEIREFENWLDSLDRPDPMPEEAENGIEGNGEKGGTIPA